MARNRVIYQSEGLYVGPSSGQGHTETLDNGTAGNPTRNGNTPAQLYRIQSINYGFDIPRQDVNQFGQLARIDQVILEQPTVDLDFTYYTETGYNDRQIGFHVGGINALAHFISGNVGEISATQKLPGNNFYIRTTAEGNDLNKGTEETSDKVIGIGNAFVTNYTTEASVGAFPTTSVTVEGLNMRFYTAGQGTAAGSAGNVPSVKPSDGTDISSNFQLPDATENKDSNMPSALRPGNIVFEGDAFQAANGTSADSKLWRGLSAKDLHIQSFSISADMSRENLERLGSKFAFSKELEFPLTVTLSMEAIVSDQVADNLSNILNTSDAKYNTIIAIKSAPGDTWSNSNGNHAIAYKVKGLKTDSLSFSSSIGDNKSVSLTATAQIGAGDDLANGLFVFAKGVATGAPNA
tara:strand:+ start:3500 stop:4723 length:1224 start_codon:yes stop_codon:yes gene_type:complete